MSRFNKFEKEFTSRGYCAVVNQPYDGKQGGNHCQNNSIGFEVDSSRKGILFEFRNDILTDPVKGPKLYADFIEILSKLAPIPKVPLQIPTVKHLAEAESLPEDAVLLASEVTDRYESDNSLVVFFNKDPKVRLVFVAEHAGKNLPEGYSWSQTDINYVVKRNLHYDPNTLELAAFLARHFSTAYIATRYSKLLLDANQQLTSSLIFPKAIGGVPVSFNQNLTFDEESSRYELYFLGLVKGIMYLHQRISSHFWFSIQGFDQTFFPSVDLIISFYANDTFAKKIGEAFQSRGYKVELNPPDFDGKQLFGYTNTTFLNGFYPRKRESLIFIISTRLLTTRLENLKKDFTELIKTHCVKD